MGLDHYTLDDDGEPVLCDGIGAWADGMRHPLRSVGDDYLISERYGMVRVSTVFLGIDHSFGGTVPLLFETMIFREKGIDEFGMPPPDDIVAVGFWGEMKRWSTRAQAAAGHAEFVELVTNAGFAPASKPPPG